MSRTLPHEVQLLAEIGQALGERVQLGSAAAGAMGAAPLRGGLQCLVQPGHCAEFPSEGRGERLLELLVPSGGEMVARVGGRCADPRTRSRSSDVSGRSVV
ncbi:hypothetical protein RCO28_16680 [Streptomyces sp. LHD-70]|uniref:hypothetical protein n=1 Tax=Streptomyces sp. LHD-70 TaxID=3072140 RepID=UPI00280E193C|nr:hypothetical protein [Streptomyces sp. LHD-70]MDQ8704111.1 hypothetical protein [Streptomyces sp. LHD-70]